MDFFTASTLSLIQRLFKDRGKRQTLFTAPTPPTPTPEPQPGVCRGIPYSIAVAGHVYKHGPRGKSRFIAQGVNHPSGLPIRFKSLQRMDRHLRNMNIGSDL